MERAICAEPALAALDVEMAAMYKQALSKTTNKDALRAQQRQWLKERNACGNTSGIGRCIQSQYKLRLSQLQ